MTFTAAPVLLHHGERYGSLTVLERTRSSKRGHKYRCGCTCGNSRFYAKASDLMSGRVKKCARCGANKDAEPQQLT